MNFTRQYQKFSSLVMEMVMELRILRLCIRNVRKH